MSIASCGQSRDQLKPLAVTVKTACAIMGIGVTKLYELIAQERLQAIKVDRRTLIVYSSLEALVAPKAAA